MAGPGPCQYMPKVRNEWNSGPRRLMPLFVQLGVTFWIMPTTFS